MNVIKTGIFPYESLSELETEIHIKKSDIQRCYVMLLTCPNKTRKHFIQMNFFRGEFLLRKPKELKIGDIVLGATKTKDTCTDNQISI